MSKNTTLSRLEYSSQLWFPHLVKHIVIDQLGKKIQRSFTKHISGMQSLEYSDHFVYLKLLLPPKEMRRLLYYICVEDNRGIGS